MVADGNFDLHPLARHERHHVRHGERQLPVYGRDVSIQHPSAAFGGDFFVAQFGLQAMPARGNATPATAKSAPDKRYHLMCCVRAHDSKTNPRDIVAAFIRNAFDDLIEKHDRRAQPGFAGAALPRLV